MTVIARIRKLNGTVQFDSSAQTYQLSGRGTVQATPRLPGAGNTTPGSVLIPIPSYDATRLIAIQSTMLLAKAGSYFHNGQNNLLFAAGASSGVVNYWLFDEARNLAAAAIGLTIRDENSGAVTYSSDFDVLRVAAVIDGPVTMQAGRSYAAILPSYAGHRLGGDGSVYFINGQESLYDGSIYPGNTQWAYRNDGKQYGVAVDGPSITTGAISWDDVIGTLGAGSTPPPKPPDWEKPLQSVLIIDVTDI